MISLFTVTIILQISQRIGGLSLEAAEPGRRLEQQHDDGHGRNDRRHQRRRTVRNGRRKSDGERGRVTAGEGGGAFEFWLL